MEKENNLFKVSEVDLVYKTRIKTSERPKINDSKDVADIMFNNWNPDTIEHIEEFKILLLNCANKVLGIKNVSKGGISGTVTDVRIIMQTAIKTNASGIIACHNHPSGNLNPSEADTKITKKIKDAGSIIDIQLLDHVIITPDKDYFSFADNGLID